MSHKKRKRIKRIGIFLLVVSLTVLGLILYANWKIPNSSQEYIYKDLDSIPEHNVVLLLGTSRYIGNRPNSYFTYRIQAVKELYEAGKVDAVVVSGDNKHLNYNEPRDMRNALVEAGVPDSIINFDFAGFRTLDSVVRMNKVFGQKNYIVVSQQFHNERAIYIARYHGIEAYGYNANDLGLNRASYRTKIREVFARVKVFIDIFWGVKPKFLGEPIEIQKKDKAVPKVDSTTIKSDSIKVTQPK